MDTHKHYDVTPKAIAKRKMIRKIEKIMDGLVNNNITHYTHVDGAPNDNYARTRELLISVLIQEKD